MAFPSTSYAQTPNSITLSWKPPTQNEDGSELTNLAGFKIYYGCQQSRQYDYVINIDSPTVTSYVVENLPAGTCYFAATAYNDQGVESKLTNEVVQAFDAAMDPPGRPVITLTWGPTVSVARDATSAGTATTGSSVSWSHTIGAGSNRALIVKVGARHTLDVNPNVSGVTFDGAGAGGPVAMTEVIQAAGTTSEIGASFWILLNPESGVGTIAVTLDAGADTWLHGAAASYSNVDQTTPQDVSAVSSVVDGSSSISIDVTPVTDGAMIVSMLAASSNDPASADDGQNEYEALNVFPEGIDDQAIFADFLLVTAGLRSTGWSGMRVTSDNVELVMVLRPASDAVTLSVNDADHSHTADSPALTQANTLAVNDADHGHTADSPAISPDVLTVNDADHGHTADSPAISPDVLTVNDADHGHTADSPALTQANTLAVNDADHAHTADSPAITQANTVSVDSAFHLHFAASPALTQANVLAANDANHGHTVDSPTLNTGIVLAVADALHLHAADNVLLTQQSILAVASAIHAHLADSPALLQQNVLAVNDALHAHAADSPALSVGNVLAVAGALHLHTADNLALIQDNVLTVDSALHAHLADLVTLLTDQVAIPSRVFRVTVGKRIYYVSR